MIICIFGSGHFLQMLQGAKRMQLSCVSMGAIYSELFDAEAATK